MTDVLVLAALLLALTLLLGLIPVLRARRAAERMLAAQLLGTTGVGLLLLLAPLLQLPALRDVAVVLALLATVTLGAFTRRVQGDPDA